MVFELRRDLIPVRNGEGKRGREANEELEKPKRVSVVCGPPQWNVVLVDPTEIHQNYIS